MDQSWCLEQQSSQHPATGKDTPLHLVNRARLLQPIKQHLSRLTGTQSFDLRMMKAALRT